MNSRKELEANEAATSLATHARLVGKAAFRGVAASTVVGAIAVEISNAYAEREKARQADVLQRLLDHTRLEVEDLYRRLNDDEELADLLGRALRASGAARTNAKRSAFAAILADAVDGSHDDRIAATAFVKILEELDEEHVQIMRVIERLYVKPLPQSGEPAISGVAHEELADALPHLRHVLNSLVGRLVSLGVLANAWAGTWGDMQGKTAFVLTDLGRAFITTLRSESWFTTQS